ncbi:hypothetical protein AVEN_106428-1 [Araneus ventricosus]|uniref:Uncharacterized protein n=1 Tax=Araneus ventricosus TaxID=182803 RepID=A0A4Y2ASG2_ARAVE|nr:hypothetical protein AVEN_106428-1 [Araneus ventricosus]
MRQLTILLNVLQQKEIQPIYQHPEAFSKRNRQKFQETDGSINGTQEILAEIFTKSFQKFETILFFGIAMKFYLQQDTGQFPTYLNRFRLRSEDKCGCGEQGSPIHYATEARPDDQLFSPQETKDVCWQRVMTSTLSRAKIRNLMDFIKKNEDILFPTS